MQKTMIWPAVCGLAVIGAMLTSCVEDDYDLSEDIDLTVSVGGNITLPASSTEAMTMGQILDLDASSAIKTVQTQGEYGLNVGDYVLVQAGEPTASSFDVPSIEISGLKGSTVSANLPEFSKPGTVTGTVSVPVSMHVNSVELSDDNVTRTVVAIDGADVDVALSYQIGFESSNYAGEAHIERGFELNFDPSWTCQIADAATAAFAQVVNGHTVRFTSDVRFSQSAPLRLSMRVVHIDFAEGQGLVSPGRFRLKSEISCQGRVGIGAADVPTGGVKMEFKTSCDLTSAHIVAVRGKFNPDITVNPTTFAIKDVPDFLKNESNNLDVDNPRICISATNTSPMPVEVSGRLVADVGGNRSVSVGIGTAYGTEAVVIAAGGESEIVISRRPLAGNGFTNIVVPDLANLIKTVPDNIMLTDVKATAVQTAVTVTLGRSYSFDAGYEAIIPLTFGRDMLIHYTDEKLDLDDLSDYNFKEAEVSLVAVNTMPLGLEPSVEAIDADGNVITDITATVDGAVRAGSVAAPVSSPVKIHLKSTAQDMGRIYGIRYVFDARSGDMVGVTLNSEQSVRFTDITIRLKGGVQVNLND